MKTVVATDKFDNPINDLGLTESSMKDYESISEQLDSLKS